MYLVTHKSQVLIVFILISLRDTQLWPQVVLELLKDLKGTYQRKTQVGGSEPADEELLQRLRKEQLGGEPPVRFKCCELRGKNLVA